MKSTPIFLAWGYQFNDNNRIRDIRLLLESLGAEKISENEYRYRNEKANKDFRISFVFDKEPFIRALDVEDAIIVYAGHSRYGQGPAFGSKDFRYCPKEENNPWEDHVRMGWDAVVTSCLADIIKHCTNPVEYPRYNKRDYLKPSVKKRAKYKRTRNCKIKKKKKRFTVCAPRIGKLKNGKGEQILKTRHFWGRQAWSPEDKKWVKEYLTATDPAYKTKKKKIPGADFSTIVKAGSSDLQKSKFRCKILYLASCSSFGHYHCALKRHRKKVNSDCVFYLTKHSSYGSISKSVYIFLEFILKEDIDLTTRTGAYFFIKEVEFNDYDVFAAREKKRKKQKIQGLKGDQLTKRIRFASGGLQFVEGKEKGKKFRCPK